MERDKVTKASLKAQLAAAEEEYSTFKYNNITKPLRDFESKLLAEHRDRLNMMRKNIDGLKDDVKNFGKDLAKKREEKLGFDPRLQDWLYWYGSGINFGYGGLHLRYVDPEYRFVILTNKGGTAGTGTAMGTGGYYYANTEHFVVFPQMGVRHMQSSNIVRRVDEEHGYTSYYGSSHFDFSGRLTKEAKEDMIKKALELYRELKLQPFNLDTIPTLKTPKMR